MNRRVAVDASAALVVSLAVMMVGWFSGSSRPMGFPLDDAWIHMVYGRSLAEHGILAYNDVATTGATSPLWACFVALAHIIGSGDLDRTVMTVYVIGVIFMLCTVFLTWRLTYFLTARRLAAFIAALLVATSGPFAMSAFSGMEVTLTSALVLAAIDACVREQWTRAGVWLGFAAVARPEVAIVSLACFVFTATTPGLVGRARWVALARLATPSVILGILLVVYALWATGHPLPATFYMKQEASVTALPGRLWGVVRGLLGDVPPFATGIAWLTFVGLFMPKRADEEARRLRLPAICGVVFVIVSALLIAPHANVFYHLRYVLPALPLLTIAAVIAAHRLGTSLAARGRAYAVAPLALLTVVGLLEALPTLPRHGARLHNDTRNIDEVQHRLGTWIAAHTEPGTWIATGDAGAIRYFGNRPTIDVMGLNTPELYWQPGWAAAHPVAAFVMLPCWFTPADPSRLGVALVAQTEGYTVTTAACMREQRVVTCVGHEPVELSFTGVKTFTLTCQPGQLRRR
jgi:hypothetical protein